ncbi:hypothetical protein [Rhizobium leguminosarum]|uniref:hypothetical protein n=1 Tax=Rhizobium leguminosarum TaxID=384 RepID=UPI0014411B97|nr:hypothetical protein [Rhizobium leguminosarum]MBY5869335.1 hypothetical protein [Rhizobium leguminosarum]NKM08400.1 hypothetical protein [Rhizobium leguminosarum bv. viciae]
MHHDVNGATPVDPLMIAIETYRDGLAAYNAAPDDLPEDAAEELYQRLVGAPYNVLANWRTPATSEETALAAMRLAGREIKEDPESAVAEAMYGAMLSFRRPRDK